MLICSSYTKQYWRDWLELQGLPHFVMYQSQTVDFVSLWIFFLLPAHFTVFTVKTTHVASTQVQWQHWFHNNNYKLSSVCSSFIFLFFFSYSYFGRTMKHIALLPLNTHVSCSCAWKVPKYLKYLIHLEVQSRPRYTEETVWDWLTCNPLCGH